MRPEPGPGSVVVFQLTLGGRTYTYAALHVAGAGWYVTSGKWPHPIPWSRLDVVVPGPIHVASGWAEVRPIPHPWT